MSWAEREQDRPPTGVLVMAHGTPSSPADIESFYAAIRHGRAPTPDLLDELVRRYETIGGISPLNERTRAQVEGVAAALDAQAPGEFLVRYGAKYCQPTIEDAVAELARTGVTQCVGIVLTPHQSLRGSGEYFRRAEKAATATSSRFDLTPVPSWHRAEGLAPILAGRLEETLESLPPTDRVRTSVFFTAHSVPELASASGDPYPAQVRESADDIAALLDLEGTPGLSWSVAWQSAGRTADRWIGPALLLEIRRVATRGATSVVVCPVGFVSDHLEVLYDLDIEAAAVSHAAGVAFARTPSLNDEPRFLAILADVVRNTASSLDGTPVVAGPTTPA